MARVECCFPLKFGTGFAFLKPVLDIFPCRCIFFKFSDLVQCYVKHQFPPLMQLSCFFFFQMRVQELMLH